MATAEPRILVDVNVLIALLDDAHVFSRRANEWLDAAPRRIATCPVIENGVIRIMSAPAYSATHRATPEQVADGLKALAEELDHQFWADEVSLLDEAAVDFSRLHGHRQITDAYLLALAVRQKGVLASFDAGVPLSAVRGATRRHLLAL
ncbi:TA system VapC family ribonuclease toxin [Pseudorhodoferax sp.]|uniref:TA system VapC family ribonuclease toxin n=1 Tax=Pseudorhodoferax sp. TaxID=1993553 RepID=UPI002DD6B50E|nr:TA system VapC family ribonuclease toxin [Pseudorhodoferax sp.]